MAGPIREDMRFQRRYWLFERIGWTILILIVAAATAGTFAGGPLSAAAGTGAGFDAAYERFARRGVDTRMTVILPAGSTLWVQGLDGFDVAAIEPKPAAARSERAGIAYDFTTGGGTIVATFHLKPRDWGLQRLKVAADPAARPTALDIFVYP
jgi:hypothetical protein